MKAKWLCILLIVLPYPCLGAIAWLFAWHGSLDLLYLPLALLVVAGTVPNVIQALYLSARAEAQPELVCWMRRIKLWLCVLSSAFCHGHCHDYHHCGAASLSAAAGDALCSAAARLALHAGCGAPCKGAGNSEPRAGACPHCTAVFAGTGRSGHTGSVCLCEGRDRPEWMNPDKPQLFCRKKRKPAAEFPCLAGICCHFLTKTATVRNK